MRAGALDRLAFIQRLTANQNATGEEVAEWVTIATVWTQKIENNGQERFLAQQYVGKSATSFKFRWSKQVKEVTTKDRIIYADKAYDIQALRELGRHEGIMADCTVRSEEAVLN